MTPLRLVPCPLCGNRESFLPLRITGRDDHIRKYGDFYAATRRSSWQACGMCGFAHQNPRPSTESLQAFYAQGRYHEADPPPAKEAYLEFAGWYYEEKVAYALASSGRSRGRVLEIGCGLGGALHQFRERGWTVLGVEPDAAQARYASDVLGLEGIRACALDESFRPDGKVDLVFSNHAFEHVVDLAALMRALTPLLAPGAHVFTAVPTYYSNRSRLSKYWMNSAHYSLFTHHSLDQLFARHGLEEVTHTYRGWRKEIDDLWHVARFTGVPSDARAHFEDPRAVQRYVNVVNPLRSVLFAPAYMGHATRVGYARGLKRAAARLFHAGPAARP